MTGEEQERARAQKKRNESKKRKRCRKEHDDKVSRSAQSNIKSGVRTHFMAYNASKKPLLIPSLHTTFH